MAAIALKFACESYCVVRSFKIFEEDKKKSYPCKTFKASSSYVYNFTIISKKRPYLFNIVSSVYF